MRAIVVSPGIANSARLEEVPEPPAKDGAVLVRALALGVCGTDREIVSGDYGTAPPGEQRLILGHESLGVVEDGAGGERATPPATSWSASCVGPIRCRARPARPANGTCAATAATPSAASRSATATARSAFASSRNSPSRSIRRSGSGRAARAGEHRRQGLGSYRAHRPARAAWEPQTLLVTGAGPVGLLAALMGVQRGLDVHVLDRDGAGRKPRLVRDLGATYHDRRRR